MSLNTALRLAALSLTIGLVVAGPAKATIIYDNGPLALGGANEIGVGSDVEFGGGQAADDFVLSSAGIFDRIVWWGSGNVATDDFAIEFFDDAGGKPADHAFLALAFEQVVPSATDFADPFDDALEYAVDVAPISLSAGVTYWISIFSTSLDAAWFWSSAGLGNLHLRNDFSPEWHTDRFADSNLGFRFVQVPEPPTLLLLMAGVLALLDVRRRARGAKEL